MFCGNCEKIVGSINPFNYKRLMFVFSCTCGNYGSIEISRNKIRYNPDERVNRMPKIRNTVCSCMMCNEPLFSVAEDRVENYSFFIECKCGEKYDTKPNFNRRLGETLKMFKESKEKG